MDFFEFLEIFLCNVLLSNSEKSLPLRYTDWEKVRGTPGGYYEGLGGVWVKLYLFFVFLHFEYFSLILL